MNSPSNKVNITKSELDGLWDYECEMMLPGTFFPDEFIDNNPGLVANRHGGEVSFDMIDDTNIQVKGERLWRDIKDTSHYEKLKEPIKWLAILGMVFPDSQLLYQYRIIGVDGVNGITHVYLTKSIDGVLKMEGWFYYVPSRILLDAIPLMEVGEAMTASKQHAVDWLKLFGKVTLTKRKK